MKVRDAVSALGIEVPDNLDGCVMALSRIGRPVHSAIRLVWDRDVGEFEDLYLASGWFAPGSISRGGGRNEENLREVFWLPFDADLADYLGCPKEDLWALSDGELMAMIERQRQDLEEAFHLAHVPIHRLDYTGYGLCAYTYVDPQDRTRVADVRKAHKAIVERLNTLAGFRFVDPQVSDAGTRVTRIPGTINTKGEVPRTVRTLFYEPGYAPLETKWTAKPPPRVVIPAHGKGLSPEAVKGIVDALRPYWQLGQMHYLGLAVSGLLAKGGIPEEQALAILESLGDDKPWRSAACVKDSYDRVRSGLACAGFTRLKELLPPDALDYITRQVDTVAMASVGRLTIRGQPVEEKKAPAKLPVPDIAYHGWFKAYCDLVEPTTEAPRAFHLGAGLTLAGALIGRRVRTEYASDPLYANLYTVLIGSSGSSRKDTAIKRALAIPQLLLDPHDMVAPPYYMATDVGSAEGLIVLLKEQSNALLYFTELSTVLRNARRKATNTILPRLIEAWDTPTVLQNLNKNTPVQAMNPYLSIIAAVQPGTLAQEITDEDIHSGFANRWLFIPGEGGDPLAVAPPLDKPLAWRHHRALTRAIAAYADGSVIPMLPDAHDRWIAWYLDTRKQSGKNEDEDAMRVRHATLIQKVALIFAVSDEAKGIGDRHLEAAIALVDWMWTHVKDLLRDWGVGIDSQIERRIETVLKRVGTTNRRTLQRVCSNRKWSGRDFAAVFDAMAKNHTIVVDATGLVAWNHEDA